VLEKGRERGSGGVVVAGGKPAYGRDGDDVALQGGMIECLERLVGGVDGIHLNVAKTKRALEVVLDYFGKQHGTEWLTEIAQLSTGEGSREIINNQER
jgi:hypothetical protein